jgi:hypothetical protein
MYQVSQASFIKIPSFLLKISCGKHSANQIAAASLNIHGICRASNLSKGLIYLVSEASFIPSEDIMRKTFSQSDYSSLIKYARNLSNIDLERGTYVPSITGKFHQNPTIPSQDIVRKAKRTDRRTDGQGDYHRAPAGP